MAENGSKVHENPFYKMKEHLRHGAHRVAHFRHPVEDPASAGAAPLAVPPSISEETDGGAGGSVNIEDFPYDSARDDVFTSELAAGAYDDDGIPSPRSQSSTFSMDTLHSSVSGGSWTSTQKNMGGLGLKEGRTQEVLGPYKRNTDERALGGVSTDYEDYINDRKPPRSSHNDTPHSAGNSSFERSSSTSSDRSVPDSLYADLSSVSDRDLQVPEGLVKPDGIENGHGHEGRASPNHTSHARDHLSNLKLNNSSD